MPDFKPQFKLYIPSKSRHEYMMTSKTLTKMGVEHNIIVEPQEVDAYQKASKDLLCKIIPLDMSYKEKYEYCDEHGTSISTGSGPARNFIWDYSVAQNETHHWIMDDNIRYFGRLNKGVRYKTNNSGIWPAMEDFSLRYKNVSMSGPNYVFFVFGAGRPPFIPNTRIYSCNLIRNDVPFRWRGRYNEDTILSLDMMTKGWCTISYNAFFQGKAATQTMRGGNTDSVYTDGTLKKSEMLRELYPEITTVKKKFGRIHHDINYRPFQKSNILKKRDDYVAEPCKHNYGFINDSKGYIREGVKIDD